MPRRRRAVSPREIGNVLAPRAWRWRTDGAAIGSLVALQMVLLWRAAVLRGFLLLSDICYFFQPAKSLLHESLRAGRLPLWSPYLFCGYPIAAEGQIAVFYPVSLLLSWLLPSSGAINWLVISHLLLAAVSMYLLARLLGLSPFSAWLAALTFSFSGYLFAHLQHVSLLCAASWLPVVILFVERAWRGPVLPNAILAGAAWAASALCGHPQTLFHITLIVLFWVGWRWVASRRAERRWPLRRAAGLLVAILALGLGLAAVQLLMTYELAAAAPHGERGSLRYVTSFSLLPKHLFGLIGPNWQGTPAFNSYTGENYYWEYVLYIGLAPLALALVGATRRRGWPLAGLGVVALALALARGNPLYQLLRFVPGFSEFRVPARYILLFTFAAALLAGQGWDVLASWRLMGRGRRLLVLGAVAAAFAASDLLWFDRTLAPMSDPRVLTAANPAAEALLSDTTWWRAWIVPASTIDAKWVPPGGWARNPDGWVEARVLLPADVPQSYGIRIIGGYATFTDPEHERFFRLALAAAQTGDPRLLSVVGTRYLVLPPQANLPGVPATRVGPFVIYRNQGAFPRAFVLSEVLPARDANEARRRTVELSRASRLGQTAVVQGEMGPLRRAASAPAKLTVEEPRPERVIVWAECERDGLLVLNDRWDRGWRVRLDGRAAPLVTVDSVLMGTPLPKGKHTVEFLYHPRGLVIGRVISFLALAVCAGLLLRPRLRRRAV